VYQGVPTWENSIPLANHGTHNIPCVSWSAILWLPPSGLKVIEGFHVEAARRMTCMRPQRRTEGPLVYPKSRDVLAAARLKPMATYIRRRRARIAKTIEGRPLLTECRGEERRLGSPPRQFWWEQEMNLEEDDDEDENGGHEGVFPRRFYDEAGQEIGPPDAATADLAGDPDPTAPPTGQD
jgi:hypothetical protein